MKITIYVQENHLETLYKFLGDHVDETKGVIEWYHNRPGVLRYFMVTIDYNEYLKLENRELENNNQQ